MKYDLTDLDHLLPPLRPWCPACGWRKGGPDSWDGEACKCGHTEPPIRHSETGKVFRFKLPPIED